MNNPPDISFRLDKGAPCGCDNTSMFDEPRQSAYRA
jgi:hypothetical protein